MNTCLIDLYPASAAGLFSLDKVEKLTDERFQVKLLPSSPSGNSKLKPPLMHLEFHTVQYISHMVQSPHPLSF